LTIWKLTISPSILQASMGKIGKSRLLNKMEWYEAV